MKRKLFILGCAALMVAGTFNSCSKDQPAPTDADSYQDFQIAETSDINKLLLQFNQKYEDFKDGKLHKSGEKISKDSVIWYIDAAINFNYASGVYSFGRLHRDTIYVEVQFDAEMKALLAEVFETYEQSLIGIGQKYYAITGEHKKFVMATVSDAGPLADGKRKLRIATLTGTGEATLSGDFGDDENYLFNRDATINCDGAQSLSATKMFEVKLLSHFEPTPPTGCRYFFFGLESTLQPKYTDPGNQLNTTLTNYLDYKIFAASDAVINHPINDEIMCLDYNHSNDVHEMQFYFDHLVTFANEWLNKLGNTGYNKKWYSGSDIVSFDESNLSQTREIWHEPILIFKKRGYTCESVNNYFPVD